MNPVSVVSFTIFAFLVHRCWSAVKEEKEDALREMRQRMERRERAEQEIRRYQEQKEAREKEARE